MTMHYTNNRGDRYSSVGTEGGTPVDELLQYLAKDLPRSFVSCSRTLSEASCHRDTLSMLVFVPH